MIIHHMSTVKQVIFEGFLFSDILKNMTSTKINSLKLKCVTSQQWLTLQQYENKTSKCNLSVVV